MRGWSPPKPKHKLVTHKNANSALPFNLQS